MFSVQRTVREKNAVIWLISVYVSLGVSWKSATVCEITQMLRREDPLGEEWETWGTHGPILQ